MNKIQAVVVMMKINQITKISQKKLKIVTKTKINKNQESQASISNQIKSANRN